MKKSLFVILFLTGKTELSHKSQCGYIHQKGAFDSAPVVDILAAISYSSGEERR